MSDPRAHARSLAAASVAAGQPTAWFEQLYAGAARGETTVPWADLAPNPQLVAWAEGNDVTGPGRAAVVGCGYGDDAEFLAARGFTVTAFDVAPTAVAAATDRFPASTVEYVTADLLRLPPAWTGAFDLVVEIYTVQVLRDAARRTAVEQCAALVAPGGTLVVIARARDEADDPGSMPWPLTRAEIGTFAAHGLQEVDVAEVLDQEVPPVRRWIGEFRRTAVPG
jgi:SAM-dependent methyltransferase